MKERERESQRERESERNHWRNWTLDVWMRSPTPERGRQYDRRGEHNAREKIVERGREREDDADRYGTVRQPMGCCKERQREREKHIPSLDRGRRKEREKGENHKEDRKEERKGRKKRNPAAK